jgi:uncharacterized repeat protein (TIGR03803 family)
MMTRGRKTVRGVILFLLLAAWPRAVAQNFSYNTLFMFGNPDFAVLHRFGDITADGSNANGVIEASDGALYGTAFFGGAALGTVFRLNKDGTVYSIIRSLKSGGSEGASPSGLMEGTDGALYGMTYLGGSGQGGTIFKLNKDGTAFNVISPNQAAAVKAPVAPRFQVGHALRRVTEQRRSAYVGSIRYE